MKVRPIFESSEWTFDLISRITDECEIIAKEELKLDYYPNQIEIISSDQMLDAYASIGMPVMYQHWSWGKHFLSNEHNYRKGYQGLAYEIVINSNPCISYLMEENTMTMQSLVIAHAAFGHNSFFKSNQLFRQWTDADGILDYLVFAREYIERCEQTYGYDRVEKTLDACHALMNQGIDRYRRPSPISASAEQQRQAEREAHAQATMNELWHTVVNQVKKTDDTPSERELRQAKLGLPEENILYFLEKKSPVLETWQREICRIVRKVSQYFYPQRQTKVMNEGWATFVHHYIMNRLHDKGLITDGSLMEFMHSHTNVVMQLPHTHPHYSGFNPYALGFAIYTDLRRICENPTEEDKAWFPDYAGTPWLETLHHAMQDYRDESFIQQFLSPTVIRDLHLFKVKDDAAQSYWEIERIHNERGYREVRSALARSYNVGFQDPDIQVVDVNLMGDRRLKLEHKVYNGVMLNQNTDAVLRHLRALWGYDIELESVDAKTGKRIDRVII